ncbi:MAG: hypothetical protein LLG20_01900 [Acidobacteriales bacterium]|nr:hypothetical protein [Terriglobales bacterium]
MTQARGSKATVVMAFETAYGVDPAGIDGIGPMPIQKFGLKATQQENVSATITDSINPTAPWRGNKDARGGITVPVDAVCMGYWLKAMFGAAVSVVTGSKTAAAVVCDPDTDKVTLSTHGLLDGQCITFAAAVMPTNLTAGTRYYLVNKGTNDFQIALTPGGTPINFSTAGTTVTITTVCAHVFKLSADMLSLVLEQAFAHITDYHNFNGCKASSMALDIGNDNSEFTMDMQFIGSGLYANGATAYDSSLTSPGTSVPLNKFQAALQEAGAAFAKATKFSLNVDFDLDDSVFVIGGAGIRGDLPQGQAKVTGNLTTLYDGPTSALTKAINETETSLMVTLTNGAYILEILIPEVKYSMAGPVVEGPKGILLPLDFVAYKDNADYGTALQLTLVNAKNTAY